MTPGWAAPSSRRPASCAAAGPGEIPDIQLQALPWSYPFPNQDAPTRHKVDKRPALTIMTTLIYPQEPRHPPPRLGRPRRGPAHRPGLPDRAPTTRGPARRDGAGPRGDEQQGHRRRHRRLSSHRGGTTRTAPRWRGSCRTGRPRCTTRSAPAGWASTSGRSSIPALRVLGVDGLRVADASIMPGVTGGNTNAPAMMIGEHCAGLMLRGCSGRRGSRRTAAAEWPPPPARCRSRRSPPTARGSTARPAAAGR